MKPGNHNLIFTLILFFFKINLVLAQEKINLQELQPTFEEELDSLRIRSKSGIIDN